MLMQGRDLSGADFDLSGDCWTSIPSGSDRDSVRSFAADWSGAQGRLKDMAARTLLLKLEGSG